MFNLIQSKQKFASTANVNRRFEKTPQFDMSSICLPLPRRPCVNVVHDGMVDLIGNTPLVKLQKIPKAYGVECDIYAKCEFMNLGGSVKDRIAFSMMNEAAKYVSMNENTFFLEPTSGNTGIGIALSAINRGAKCTVVIPRKHSAEKVNTIRLLGAEVIEINDNQSAMALARRIKLENPEHVVMLDRFENEVSPRTHYEQTAAEILEALGSVDLFVAGAGTGGTLTGVGWRLKDEVAHKCHVLGADPDGSVTFSTKDDVEGIGSKETPIVLDVSVTDAVGKVTDEDAFNMARELASKEGLLCGGSSGLAMAAAIKYVQKHHGSFGAGKRVVVLLPDDIRNYMSKFVQEQWMEAHLFKQPPEHTMKWWKHPVTNIKPRKSYLTINGSEICAEALKQMCDNTLAIVVNELDHYIGAVSKDSLRHLATNPTKLPGHPSEDFDFKHALLKDHLIRDCYTLALNCKKGVPTVGLLSRILDITSFVVVVEEVQDQGHGYLKAVAVVDGDDVLDYIFSKQ